MEIWFVSNEGVFMSSIFTCADYKSEIDTQKKTN